MTKNKEIGIKISIGLLVIFIFMLTFGLVSFKTRFQKLLWSSAHLLFLYGIILIYLFSTRPEMSFWRLNAYFGIGLTVWAIPMMLVISELGETIAYMSGLGLIVMGISIAGFSFWADKKGIEVD